MIDVCNQISIRTKDGEKNYYILDSTIPVKGILDILQHSKYIHLKRYDRVIMVENIVYIDFFHRENNESN